MTTTVTFSPSETKPAESPGVGIGSGPLVVGECVQGRRPDGLHFLITAPLAVHSTARFERGEEPLRVEPPNRTKALRAVSAYLTDNDLPARGTLYIETPLPLSNGFGTSTADITASLRAVADSWARTVSPETISKYAIDIEPTDGSMYPESVAYAHREGRLLERLGQLPPFRALVVLDGQTIDTVEFDKWRHNISYTSEEIEQFSKAPEVIREANRQGDLQKIARACTASARINDRFVPKPLFAEMLSLVDQGLGEGLIAAHSGTALSLILDPSRPGASERYAEALRRVDALPHQGRLELANFSGDLTAGLK